MNSVAEQLLNKAFEIDRHKCEDLVPRLRSSALAKSHENVGNPYNSAAIFAGLSLPEIEKKAKRISDSTAGVLRSRRIAAGEDEAAIVKMYDQAMDGFYKQLRVNYENLKTPDQRTSIDHWPRNALRSIAESRISFLNMLAEAASHAEAHQQMKPQNITVGSIGNAQFGDGNVQNIQSVQVLRELVAKIDSSKESSEKKAEAKNLLTRFLEHPVTVATVGAMAKAVFEGAK